MGTPKEKLNKRLINKKERHLHTPRMTMNQGRDTKHTKIRT